MIKLKIPGITCLIILCALNLQAQDKTLANSKAVIMSGKNTRFTILTPHTIRMEWDSIGLFNDRASFVVVNRNLPVPAFTHAIVNGWMVIKTKELEIKYRENSGRFNADNLSINYLGAKSNSFTWVPGTNQKDNLKGTARTLDTYDGDSSLRANRPKLKLEDGLISKDGWYFLDDSKSFLFDKSPWPWVTQRAAGNAQDWYFIGYGHNYKSALYDFTQIAGKVPLPPRYAFGYWWSRYWKYSDNDLRDLVTNFDKFNLPLDVLVIDMDWHKKLNSDGWTGWTFDDALFTNPEKSLKWIAEKNLKVTLNLHPASGIDASEPSYKAVAASMKFDTTGHKTIPYLGSDKKFAQALFNEVLRPLEKQGVSFWWLDWQQWENDKAISGLSNTWWINYLFFSDMERNAVGRPLLYHRWGGLGNHRYQIGFSGDTYISWKTLNYQPYFTNTASNVLYDYWSHDIGGHMLARGTNELDPELYTRWMQYGALSPIFRTHSTKNAILNKEVWNFKGDYFEALSNAIKLRYTLAPYIYTMARKTYDTGIALCKPLYYEYPESKEAYEFTTEYQFGNDVLVAPIGTAMVNGQSKVRVWLPPGNDWYEWHTGTLLKGGQTIERKFSLLEYPIYIKAGAVIPMYGDVKNLAQNPDKMVLGIFPGSGASADIYEDAGNSKDYSKQYTFTRVVSVTKNRTTAINILPRKGFFKGMASQKAYQIKLYGSEMPESIFVNGKPVYYTNKPAQLSWGYDGNELCVYINIPIVPSTVGAKIMVNYSKSKFADVNDGLLEKMKRLRKATTALKFKTPGLEIPLALGSAEELNNALAYYPDKFYSLVREFNANYKDIPTNVTKMKISKENQEWYLKALDLN